MQLITALAIAIIFSLAIYLILRKSLIKMLFGFALLNHAANLFVLVMAGNPIGKSAPIVSENTLRPCGDPLPHALILTAIVIGFSVTAYFIVFLYRLFMHSNTTNLEGIYPDDD